MLKIICLKMSISDERADPYNSLIVQSFELIQQELH